MNDKQIFQVENVKCGGCANTLKKAFFEEFGEVEVNLEVMPREITLKIEENQLESLKIKLKALGYPLSSDELNTSESQMPSAKKFRPRPLPIPLLPILPSAFTLMEGQLILPLLSIAHADADDEFCIVMS